MIPLAIERDDDFPDLPVGDDDPDSSGPERSSPTVSFLATRGVDTVDLLTLAAALVLVIGFVPMSLVPGWTPRIAVLIAALPLAAMVLALQLLRRDRIAIVSVALVVWTSVSAVLSESPRYALLGTHGSDQSGLIIIGSLGLMALGRNLSSGGRRALGPVFVGATALSGFVAFAQFFLRVESGPFAIGGGRVFGLTTNPVYFGAVVTGALAVVAARGVARGWVVPGVLVGGFATLAVLSGSRISLVGVLLGALWPLVHWRTRRELAVIVSAVAGLVAGNFLAGTYGSGSIDRVADAGSNGRLSVWRSSLVPVIERPVFGWGPGQFRSAAQSHFDAALQAAQGRELLNGIRDPHNIIVGTAVSLGLVGLAIVVALTIQLLRKSRGALAVGGAVIALSWLLQPAPVMTLPLALMLIGAGLPAASSSTALRSLDRRHASVLLVFAGLAGYLLVADIRVRAAAESFDAHAVEEAIGWLPSDPILTDVATVVWMLDSSVPATEAVARSAESAERSAELQPGLAAWWSKLAIREFLAGEPELARSAAERALELEPYSFTALSVLQEVAVVTDDQGLADAYFEKLCAVGLLECAS